MPDPTYEAGVRDERARVVVRGERIECVMCGEVEMWCQCEPSPFDANDLERGEHEEARDGGE